MFIKIRSHGDALEMSITEGLILQCDKVHKQGAFV